MGRETEFLSPEPTPDWPEFLEQWGAYWKAHVYIFGSLFVAVGLWNICSSILLMLAKHRGVSKRTFKCFLTTNMLLTLFNMIRGLSLLLDPYCSNFHSLSYSTGAGFLVWGFTVPCFTASFMLVNFTLLEVTKIQVYSKKLQNLKLIMGVVVFNFIFGITVDLVTVFFPSVYWLLYACQFFFLLLGMVIAASMMYSGYRVIHSVRQSRNNLLSFGNVNVSEGRSAVVMSWNTHRGIRSESQQNQSTSMKAQEYRTSKDVAMNKVVKAAAKTHAVAINDALEVDEVERVNSDHAATGSDKHSEVKPRASKSVFSIDEHIENPPYGRQSTTLGLGSRAKAKGNKRNSRINTARNIMKITIIVLVVSVCAILYSVAQIYSLVDVYKFSDPNYVIDEWPWFVYQTSARLLEIGMSASLSYVVRGSIEAR